MVIPTKGQENNLINNLNFRIGYFADVGLLFYKPNYYSDQRPYWLPFGNNPKSEGKIKGGYSLSVGYETALPTGFTLSVNLLKARLSSFFNDPLALYWDEKSFTNYYIAEISFKKDLLNNANFSLLPKVGLFYRHLIFEDISYAFDTDGYQHILRSLPEFGKKYFDDLGLSFGIDFRYVFQNRFFAGLSFGTYLILDIGIETINVSPIVGVKF
ncbi:MAG TPA: hypothetical protein DCM62_08005 [Bacteroidales bacterium]|nr:hypothetical protein [Bacteroidales bacterium]